MPIGARTRIDVGTVPGTDTVRTEVIGIVTFGAGFDWIVVGWVANWADGGTLETGIADKVTVVTVVVDIDDGLDE